MARNRNRGGRNLPTERHSLGRIVYCCVATLRRSCLATVYQVKFVTVVVAIGIRTDKCLVCEAETLTSLLTDAYALCDFGTSITFCKFVRIHVCFDRGCVLFSRIQIEVFTVVGPQRGCFCARRRLRNVCYAVPSHTGAILSGAGLRIQSHIAYTSFKQLLADLIPYQGCKRSHIVYPP